jgi:hypothetical protein
MVYREAECMHVLGILSTDKSSGPSRAQVYLCPRTTICGFVLLKMCADTSMGWAEREASEEERLLVDDDRAAQV